MPRKILCLCLVWAALLVLPGALPALCAADVAELEQKLAVNCTLFFGRGKWYPYPAPFVRRYWFRNSSGVSPLSLTWRRRVFQ